MEFTAPANLKTRKRADLLLLPFWKGKRRAECAFTSDEPAFDVDSPIAAKDFHGEEGELTVLYPAGQPEKRAVLLGLGTMESITLEKLRRAYAHATKLCHKKKWTDANILLPDCLSLSKEDRIRGVVEGLLLPNYIFSALKMEAVKKEKPLLLE